MISADAVGAGGECRGKGLRSQTVAEDRANGQRVIGTASKNAQRESLPYDAKYIHM